MSVLIRGSPQYSFVYLEHYFGRQQCDRPCWTDMHSEALLLSLLTGVNWSGMVGIALLSWVNICIVALKLKWKFMPWRTMWTDELEGMWTEEVDGL